MKSTNGQTFYPMIKWLHLSSSTKELSICVQTVSVMPYNVSAQNRTRYFNLLSGALRSLQVTYHRHYISHLHLNAYLFAVLLGYS